MPTEMLGTLELDGIPILFDMIHNPYCNEDIPQSWKDRLLELGDRITFGEWPSNDYPLRGHMLIVALEKLRESELLREV